jgi:long-chain acyl-CoA synthetase
MTTSLLDYFLHNVEARPEAPALRHKRDGQWQDLSWAQLRERQLALTAALVARGVRPGDRVSILCNTRAEWLLMDLGIMGAGAITVPIYPSSVPEDCVHILADSGAVLLLAEDAGQLAKLEGRSAHLPQLRGVVLVDGAPAASAEDVQGWEAFVASGKAYLVDHAAEVEAARHTLSPASLATLIYTSGTTGRPKGVMLTHDSFIYEAEVADQTGHMKPEDVHLLFLPMAHVFAKIIEVCWLRMAFVLALAESIDKLIQNIPEVRPTTMCAVPRVYERIYSGLLQRGTEPGGLRAALFRMAVRESEAAGRATDEGRTHRSLGWTASQRLVFPRIREQLRNRLGGRLKFFISGGAPLSRRIAHFMSHAGVLICEGYGLTETCAATTVNKPDAIRIGTVGPPIPGTQVRIAQDGEVLIRGRGVMKGYWNNPEATAEVLEPDGWFHSGDIGAVDSEGYLTITDRKKDLIVTAGGKNVAPQNLENALKAAHMLISQVVVLGDRRRFLSALITVHEDVARRLIREAGQPEPPPATPVAEHPVVKSTVDGAVQAFNATLASYETLKKWAVLPVDFTVGDELTPTLKVRRKHCAQKYKAVLDGFYGDEVLE